MKKKKRFFFNEYKTENNVSFCRSILIDNFRLWMAYFTLQSMAIPLAQFLTQACRFSS